MWIKGIREVVSVVRETGHGMASYSAGMRLEVTQRTHFSPLFSRICVLCMKSNKRGSHRSCDLKAAI